MDFKRFICLLLGMLCLAKAATAEVTEAQEAYQRGVREEAAKEYVFAIGDYQAAIYADSSYAPAYQALGNVYYYLGHLNDALSAYEMALKLAPKNSRLSEFVKTLKGRVGGNTSPNSEIEMNANLDNNGNSNTWTKKRFEFELDGGIAPLGTNRTIISPNGYTVSNGGTTLTFSGFDASFGGTSLGFEGGGTFGFMLNPNVSLLASIEYGAFSQSATDTFLNTEGVNNNLTQTLGLNQTSLAMLLGGKYEIGMDRIRPYFLAEGGICDFTTLINYNATESGIGATASASKSITCPIFALGLGIDFSISDQVNMFLQSRIVIVNVSGFSETVPVNLSNAPSGTTASNTSFSISGGTLFYVPVEVGMGYNF